MKIVLLLVINMYAGNENVAIKPGEVINCVAIVVEAMSTSSFYNKASMMPSKKKNDPYIGEVGGDNNLCVS